MLRTCDVVFGVGVIMFAAGAAMASWGLLFSSLFVIGLAVYLL